MPKPHKNKPTTRQKRMLSEYENQQNVSVQSVQSSISDIDSVESLYKALNDQEEIKTKAVLMLMLRSWLTEVSIFDPVSGHALHTGIVDFMDVVAKSMQDEALEDETKDRIYRIVSHTKESVLAIIEHTRDKILREHAMLPIHAAREVDSKSVQWLSRQPGRNLREKLSGKPYILAVRRRATVDTSENRLLKAFLLRLEEILIERQIALQSNSEETCEALLVSLQRWIRSDDFTEIGTWENLPPNNTLLQDKRYRKIWDGWLWLQGIDEQIMRDSKRIQDDILSVIYWNTLSLLSHTGRFRTVQQPVVLDYDKYSITPNLPIRGYLFPIRKSTNVPMSITLKFSTEQINIGVNKETISVRIDNGHIVLTQDTRGTKKKLKIEPSALKEIPKTILSLITNLPFEYSVPENNQSDLMRMDYSVVDLCSIRPKFTNNTGSQAHLPFRLLQQHWPLNVDRDLVIDCGYANAIDLHSDIETVSMRSLFLHSSTLSDAAKSSASKFFIKKLSDHIKTDRLTYLVPDWGNDFDLEDIRKSVNFYFDYSSPLPKSISAIFAWQSSKKFEKDKVRENDFVLVVDAFDGCISITPVEAIYQKELDEILPETQGISWERHPTFIVENKNIHTDLIGNLAKDGFQSSEELIQLFGFDGLASDAGKVSFVKDDNWYHLPGLIEETLLSMRSVLSEADIDECLKVLNKSKSKTATVFVLFSDISLDSSKISSRYHLLDKNLRLVEGGGSLDLWQNVVAISDHDIALWRDHLPELSIRIVRDGRFENFYLVKDATVTPKRGKTVDIPVKESFTLPAGQTHYSFPLQQGEGNKELQFVAYLKSPAFPLKEDTVCRLKMTYTYGADDPYELKFIPLDSEEAGFKSIRVEWRSASDSEAADLENLPVPDFPARKSWSDFQKFPKEDGKSFSDLLDWMERDLEKISDISRYGRVAGVIPKWIDKGGDNVFCFIDDVFIHKSSLRLGKGQELPQHGETLSFYKIKDDKKKFSAEDVAIGSDQPKGCFLSKSFRFPALTIWNHGHSLSESDVPDHFRNAIWEGTQKSLSIIESENMPEPLKEELFFFLCCLHKDAPGIVGSRLLEAVKNKEGLRRYHKNIAFAIGNAELPYQQELLEKVTDLIKTKDEELYSRGLKILGTALWRSENLLAKIGLKEFSTIASKLYISLEIKAEKNELVDKYKNIKPSVVIRLELLLALLRSRGIEDDAVKMIFAPDNDLTKKYVTLIDDVSRIVIDSDIELKSRISLQIEKPEMFRNTPDLLYALRMFLTGDSGANTIIVTGVSDVD